MTSDEHLLSRWRNGADDAFLEIENRYRKLVWSICRRVLLSPAEAEDATQEAFVKLWLSRASYSADKPFWPWFRAIVLRTCLDRLRTLSRSREVSLDFGDRVGRNTIAPLPSLPPNFEWDTTTRMAELRGAFDDCWRILPVDQRALLQCIDWSDWKKSWAEVAHLTGKTQDAVRIATVRYTKTLLNCLKSRGLEPTRSELLNILENSTSMERE